MVLVPDEMVTMDPPPPAAMTGMAWRANRRAPRVVTSIARSQTPRSTPTASVSRRGWLQAALWSTASTVPNSATARRDERDDRLLAADVAQQADGPAPEALHFPGYRRGTLNRDVAHHHRGAGSGQPQCGGAADVGGTPADKEDLAVELPPFRRHAAIVGGPHGRHHPVSGRRQEFGRGPLTWEYADVRVHRSFAFVDVSGFTALTELEGDERAVDVLTAFRALLRDICSRRGVRIVKWLGDGVMLVCVDTRPLLETILELHYVVGEVGAVETVSIRSGLTEGDVILMEGDDYVGHCVNVASRLCDLAAAGEALAAPAVMGDLPSWGEVLSETHVTLPRGREAGARLEHPYRARARTLRSIPSAGCHSPRTPPRRSPTTSAAPWCSSARRAASTPGGAGRHARSPADGASPHGPAIGVHASPRSPQHQFHLADTRGELKGGARNQECVNSQNSTCPPR